MIVSYFAFVFLFVCMYICLYIVMYHNVYVLLFVIVCAYVCLFFWGPPCTGILAFCGTRLGKIDNNNNN